MHSNFFQEGQMAFRAWYNNKGYGILECPYAKYSFAADQWLLGCKYPFQD